MTERGARAFRSNSCDSCFINTYIVVQESITENINSIESRQLDDNSPLTDLGITEPAQPKGSFPKRSFGKGKNVRHRSFAAEWYKSRPWLEYSRQADAAFCFPCRKFSSMTKNVKDRSEHCFVFGGYRNWKSATKHHKGFSKHEQSAAHKLNLSCWMAA